MKKAHQTGTEEEVFISRVRTRISELLASEMPGFEFDAADGKMLRGRLVHAMGGHNLESAAAVELMHSGSLFHDDVIDDADLRRGKPAFWKACGIKGAILIGDLHFFLALRLLANQPGLQKELIETAGIVCKAAAEEEFSQIPQDRVKLARRKTGPLFAFAAMTGAMDEESRAALREAGFLIGTAYQLADDIYDATGKEPQADKSLRRDKSAPAVTLQAIEALCEKSSGLLKDWPDLQGAWDRYLDRHIRPAIDHFTAEAPC